MWGMGAWPESVQALLHHHPSRGCAGSSVCPTPSAECCKSKKATRRCILQNATEDRGVETMGGSGGTNPATRRPTAPKDSPTLRWTHEDAAMPVQVEN